MRDPMDNVEPLAGHAKTDSRLSPRAKAMLDRVQNVADFAPSLDRSYIVKGWLTTGTMSLIFGPSNTGKTFLALDLARHVAAGAAWNGCRVRSGPVMYLAAEGGHGVANRVAAIEEREGLPFWVLPVGMDLHKGDDATALISMIKHLAKLHGPYALIVVDTLARAMGHGDENGSADMGAFVRNVDRIRSMTGAHVMVVHHVGKDASKGARGHSSLRAAVDTEIELQAEGDTILAETKKQRDLPAGRSFAFRLAEVELGLDADGDRVTTCRVEPCDAPNKQPKVSGAVLIALQALDDALAQHGAIRKQDGVPECRVVSIKKWREMADAHGLSDSEDRDSRKRTFNRAVRTLREREFIRQYNDLVWRCTK